MARAEIEQLQRGRALHELAQRGVSERVGRQDELAERPPGIEDRSDCGRRQVRPADAQRPGPEVRGAGHDAHRLLALADELEATDEAELGHRRDACELVVRGLEVERRRRRGAIERFGSRDECGPATVDLRGEATLELHDREPLGRRIPGRAVRCQRGVGLTPERRVLRGAEARRDDLGARIAALVEPRGVGFARCVVVGRGHDGCEQLVLHRAQRTAMLEPAHGLFVRVG